MALCSLTEIAACLSCNLLLTDEKGNQERHSLVLLLQEEEEEEEEEEEQVQEEEDGKLDFRTTSTMSSSLSSSRRFVQKTDSTQSTKKKNSTSEIIAAWSDPTSVSRRHGREILSSRTTTADRSMRSSYPTTYRWMEKANKSTNFRSIVVSSSGSFHHHGGGVVNQLTEPVSPFDELLIHPSFNGISHTTDFVLAAERDDNFFQRPQQLEQHQRSRDCKVHDDSMEPEISTTFSKHQERKHDAAVDVQEGRDPNHEVSRALVSTNTDRCCDFSTSDKHCGTNNLLLSHEYDPSYPQYGHLKSLYPNNNNNNNNNNRTHSRENTSKQYRENKHTSERCANYRRSENNPHQVPVIVSLPPSIESTESKDTSEITIDSAIIGNSDGNHNRDDDDDDELSALLSSARKLSFGTTKDDEIMSQLHYPDPPLDVPAMIVSILNDIWPSDEEVDSSPIKKKDSKMSARNVHTARNRSHANASVERQAEKRQLRQSKSRRMKVV